MIELFVDIPEEVKCVAERIWDLAEHLHDPIAVTNFLDSAKKYYSYLYGEEADNFLNFYINMKLEELKR